MRIVDRQTFLSLPSGTLYSKWEPCIFSDLYIKGDTIVHSVTFCPIDWFYQSIIDAIEHKGSDDWAQKQLDSQQRMIAGLPQEEISMDFYCEGRDGEFEEDQLFAVWSQDDVASLICRLGGAWTQVRKHG